MRSSDSVRTIIPHSSSLTSAGVRGPTKVLQSPPLPLALYNLASFFCCLCQAPEGFELVCSVSLGHMEILHVPMDVSGWGGDRASVLAGEIKGNIVLSCCCFCSSFLFPSLPFSFPLSLLLPLLPSLPLSSATCKAPIWAQGCGSE